MMSFQFHDLMCYNMSFGKINTNKMGGFPGLVIQLAWVQITCKGKWKTTGSVSWLVVGDGTITAQTDETKNNHATVGFYLVAHQRPNVYDWVYSTTCKADLNFQISLSGGVAAYITDKLMGYFSGTLSEIIKGQIERKVCGVMEKQVEPQLSQQLQKLNTLLLPPLDMNAPDRLQERRLEENSSSEPTLQVTDTNASSSEPVLPDHGDVDDRPAGPGIVDWTNTQALEWASWISTEVLPPDAIHELSRWALQGAEDMHLNLAGLPHMEHGFVVDQAAAGLRLGATATLEEIVVHGAQSLKAYSMEAVSPTELQFSAEFGTEEQPKVGFSATMLVRLQAQDTEDWWRHDAVSSVEERMSFRVAFLRPRARVQARLLCKDDPTTPLYTASQWFWDPVHCSRSLFVEAPTIEKQNLTFAGLAEPLSWTPLTQGVLEHDLSTLFNELVALFNTLYEEHLPEALMRLGGSQNGLEAVNKVLAHLASPTKCMDLSNANHRTQGRYGEEFSDWPKLLTSQLKDWMDNMVTGFLEANETSVLKFVSNMPAISAGPFTKLRLTDMGVSGTNQITDARFMVPNAHAPETLGFYMTTGCPHGEKSYSATLAMRLAAETPPGEALVEVDAPCGTFEMVLNVSLDTMKTANMLVPPTLFCTLLTPFKTLKVEDLKLVFESTGEVRVTLGSTSHKPVQELWALYPQLSAAVHAMLQSLASAENLTEVLEFLHQEAVRECDAKAERRLTAKKSGSKSVDALGISYDEGFNPVVWLASLLGGLAAAALVLAAVVWQAGRQKVSASKPLGVHCWLAARGNARWMVVAVCTMLAFSVILRIVACSLPYTSLTMSMFYTPSRLELDSQTVATFTYWGLALQFKAGGGSIIFIKFVLTSLACGMVSCALLALPWLLGLSFPAQHVLIRVAIWIGRLPFQESQTLANAALSMNANLALPMDAESQMRMLPLVGPFVAITACLLCLGAGVVMALSLPQRSAKTTESPDDKQWALPDLALCSGILTGTFIWLFFSFLSVGFQGLAGMVLAPGTYSGMDLGAYSPGLKSVLLLQTVVAPVGQAIFVALRAIELVSERWRPLEELCMSLNTLDVFAIVFLFSFVENVDGFTTSFVSSNFADIAANVRKLFGMPAVGVDVAVVEMGTVGLCIAAICTLVLYIRSSMYFHTFVPKVVARRDVEDSTVAVELQ
ncbi:unnamed protein product [Symbiodinium natans]|uniref:Uncharacterized protein n=1 Tax=Symbiodinium natans TaxID=878477 RepID=A0A812UNK4_9DINO|nr:unnamed protein product [Symbiodinium natans]